MQLQKPAGAAPAPPAPPPPSAAGEGVVCECVQPKRTRFECCVCGRMWVWGVGSLMNTLCTSANLVFGISVYVSHVASHTLSASSVARQRAMVRPISQA
eukprot:418092-Pelagomonas_calceolata.AAC.1